MHQLRLCAERIQHVAENWDRADWMLGDWAYWQIKELQRQFKMQRLERLDREEKGSPRARSPHRGRAWK